MGKINKGGLPVLQGWRDHLLKTRRDTGETRSESAREVSDARDLGAAWRLVTQSVKMRGYRDWRTMHPTRGERREKKRRTSLDVEQG